ncbi:MAG: DUF5654 family protein [Gemmatimonadota bacterium]
MRKEVIDQFAALITAAFGLVAALAWNGAIQAAFVSIFGEAGSLTPLFGYAVVVTILAIALTLWIGKLAANAARRADLEAAAVAPQRN